jgi:MtaA/CmuA family methyltransferase
MTSLERCMAVIRHEVPDCVPVALHNFLMAARMAGIPLSQCLRSGELMAEAHLVAWRRFGHDMLLVENGTTAVAQAFGCGVAYSDEIAPRVVDPVLKELADIDRLRIPDPDRDFPLTEVLEAVRILRREIGDRVCIMGRADQAPMALAAAMRHHERFLLDLGEADDLRLIGHVIDVCREATTRYALALRDAGAHVTSIGEFGSDVISPRMYRELAIPRLKQFFAAMRQAGLPAALHQCGNSTSVLSDMVSTGADILELDVHTDGVAARQVTRGRAAVLGMVDPAGVLARGTPDLVRERTRRALDTLGPGGGFFVGPGCALVPEVPEENIAALVETARAGGRYRADGTLASG